MKQSMRLSRAVDLVKAFETFEPRAVATADGRLTIGYGHVLTARKGVEVNENQAEALLLHDLRSTATAVEGCLLAPVNVNQFEALTAFAFNIGLENFRGSTALRRLNAGDELSAAREIERWRWAEFSGGGQVVDSLVRRRAAEKLMFLTPPDGFPKTSRVSLRPQFDPQLAEDLGVDEDPEPPPIAGPDKERVASAQPLSYVQHSQLGEDDKAARMEEAVAPPLMVLPPELDRSPSLSAASIERRIEPSETTVSDRDRAQTRGAPLHPFRGAFRSPPETVSSSISGAPTPGLGRSEARLKGFLLRISHLLAAATLRRWLIVLGAAGLILFMSSVFWLLNTHPGGFNLLLGLLGVIFLTPSAYVFLGRRRGP